MKGTNACFHYGKEGHKKKDFNCKHYKDKLGDGGMTHPKCQRCGENHGGPCRRNISAYFGCGKICHKLVDCPFIQRKCKGGRLLAHGSYVDQVPQGGVEVPNAITSKLKFPWL